MSAHTKLSHAMLTIGHVRAHTNLALAKNRRKVFQSLLSWRF